MEVKCLKLEVPKVPKIMEATHFNPGPDLACKACLSRLDLRDTATSPLYLGNVAPGQAIAHFELYRKVI